MKRKKCETVFLRVSGQRGVEVFATIVRVSMSLDGLELTGGHVHEMRNRGVQMSILALLKKVM